MFSVARLVPQSTSLFHLLAYNDIISHVSLDALLPVMVASIGRRHASRQPLSTSSAPHRHRLSRRTLQLGSSRLTR